MTTVFINPGTEPDPRATLNNAVIVAGYLVNDVEARPCSWVRAPTRDADGWFGFDFTINGKVYEVDIPGDEPDVVRRGEPWVSRRLYVNGSSWLYGFALNRLDETND